MVFYVLEKGNNGHQDIKKKKKRKCIGFIIYLALFYLRF